MGTVHENDTVIDAIAEIEVLRRATEREAGFAMSRSSALHRLHELLDHETEALRLRGPGSKHEANVEAVKTEIARVKGLSPATSEGAARRNSYPGQLKAS